MISPIDSAREVQQGLRGLSNLVGNIPDELQIIKGDELSCLLEALIEKLEDSLNQLEQQRKLRLA